MPTKTLYRSFLLLWMVLCPSAVFGQIRRVEPPNWWIGFEQQALQLMIYGEEVSTYKVSVDYPGVKLSAVHKADNPNYLFLDLQIDKKTKAGIMTILLEPEKGRKRRLKYELLGREGDASSLQGFNAKDVIYLITPDRFANGNPSNDQVPGMLEQEIDRSDDYARHGGDLRGIIDHLDYIEGMGFTAIWSSPLLENNMAEQSYHGYAITDYYAVDPRFGSLEDYQKLAKECERRGIKLIMDQVANHCGRNHWWMEDLPFGDWVNHQQAFEKGQTLPNSNHRRTTHQDPYASVSDQQGMTAGWFVEAMPDLNQQNKFLANYLIQNSIWWIETLRLGGIRQDTYPYPDKAFMAEWAGRIRREYPRFSIVGEEWSYNPLLVGYWQEGAQNKDGYQSNLPSSMDFPLQKALREALIEEESWDKGLIKLYEGLANDFHYSDPQALLLFTDNHDMDRISTQLGEDPALIRMALTFLLVSPRIPQVYYGTEILMQNSAKPGDHGLIRTDFPGGWEGDTLDAFKGENLSVHQKEMQEFLRKLLNFRKGSELIHNGRTKHFAPEQGTYAFFRYTDDEILMLLLNKNEEEKSLDLSRFKEMGITQMNYYDVWSEKTGKLSSHLRLPPRSTTLLLLKN